MGLLATTLKGFAAQAFQEVLTGQAVPAVCACHFQKMLFDSWPALLLTLQVVASYISCMIKVVEDQRTIEKLHKQFLQKLASGSESSAHPFLQIP